MDFTYPEIILGNKSLDLECIPSVLGLAVPTAVFAHDANVYPERAWVGGDERATQTTQSRVSRACLGWRDWQEPLRSIFWCVPSVLGLAVLRGKNDGNTQVYPERAWVAGLPSQHQHQLAGVSRAWLGLALHGEKVRSDLAVSERAWLAGKPF